MVEDASDTDGTALTPLRILIAEDDPVIGLLLAEMLGVLGHEVCGVEATPHGTVATALRLQPDLMLIDVRLKDGSGVEAVDEILRVQAVPHVLMSGVHIFATAPSVPVLFKPFTEYALVGAIHQAMNGLVPHQGDLDGRNMNAVPRASSDHSSSAVG